MYTNMTTNLMVESVDESIMFYRDVLGFSVVESVPNERGGIQFAILTKDAQNLMLQERISFIAECPSLDTPKVYPSVSLYITIDNFEELYSDIKKKAKILSNVHTTFYGAKEFAVADNNGYVLSFAEASKA